MYSFGVLYIACIWCIFHLVLTSTKTYFFKVIASNFIMKTVSVACWVHVIWLTSWILVICNSWSNLNNTTWCIEFYVYTLFPNNICLPTVNAAQVGVWRQIAVQSLVIPVPGCVRMPCVAPNTNFTPDVFSYVSVPPKHWPSNEQVSHI